MGIVWLSTFALPSSCCSNIITVTLVTAQLCDSFISKMTGFSLVYLNILNYPLNWKITSIIQSSVIFHVPITILNVQKTFVECIMNHSQVKFYFLNAVVVPWKFPKLMVLLYSSSTDAVTSYHKLDSLKTTESIFSWYWKPEVQNQGVNRLMLTLGVLRKKSFLVSFSFWCLPAFHGLWPYHSNLYLHCHNDSPILCHISLCLSLIITLIMMASRSTHIIQDHLILSP